MSKAISTPVGFYKEFEPDLQKGLQLADNIECNLLITPIVDPIFVREFKNELSTHLSHIKFTRSDLLLEPCKWTSRIIAKLSEVDCDSSNENIRKASESTIKQEMGFAQHVANTGCMMIKLRGSNTMNLASIVASELKGDFDNISSLFKSLNHIYYFNSNI